MVSVLTTACTIHMLVIYPGKLASVLHKYLMNSQKYRACRLHKGSMWNSIHYSYNTVPTLTLASEVNCHELCTAAPFQAAYLLLNMALNKLIMLDRERNGYGFLSVRNLMTQILLDNLVKVSDHITRIWTLSSIPVLLIYTGSAQSISLKHRDCQNWIYKIVPQQL